MCMYHLWLLQYVFLFVQYVDVYNAGDVSTLQYPLGAPISIILEIFADSLVTTPEYTFLPLYHTPLQQANFFTSGLVTVAVSYMHASPSLTGTYILCRIESQDPALCGGKITINVTGKLCWKYLMLWLFNGLHRWNVRWFVPGESLF